MHDALERIGLGFTSSYLSDFLCGKLESKSTHFTGNLPTTYTVPSVDQLNNTQKRAIQLGLENVICLIQGPPGTGKTITSTCLIYHLNRVTGRKVIALAPSNTAVDNLCARVAKTGLNVVRLYSLAKEKQSTRLNELSVRVKALQLNPGLARLQLEKNRGEFKSQEQQNLFQELKKLAEFAYCRRPM
ncbi:Regulator of nonsense transcripts protein [Fasciola hepatica]|uniref:Regulator of nonsense transcripts protein n=1 Tax=Fasciola hepatica TaxID=6192 RepID=A0A4E0RW47_FASHE|nr:Regulator of nonsense transcripts protein [Fasciola hepatica]